MLIGAAHAPDDYETIDCDQRGCVLTGSGLAGAKRARQALTIVPASGLPLRRPT